MSTTCHFGCLRRGYASVDEVCPSLLYALTFTTFFSYSSNAVRYYISPAASSYVIVVRRPEAPAHARSFPLQAKFTADDDHHRYILDVMLVQRSRADIYTAILDEMSSRERGPPHVHILSQYVCPSLVILQMYVLASCANPSRALRRRKRMSRHISSSGSTTLHFYISRGRRSIDIHPMRRSSLLRHIVSTSSDDIYNC